MNNNSEVVTQLLLAVNSVQRLEDGRVARYYIVRAADPLPDREALEKLGVFAEDGALERIREHLPFKSSAEIAELRPAVELFRLDDSHLIVSMKHCAKDMGTNIGAADLLSQSEILRAVDKAIRIEELQGIPREYWFILRSS